MGEEEGGEEEGGEGDFPLSFGGVPEGFARLKLSRLRYGWEGGDSDGVWGDVEEEGELELELEELEEDELDEELELEKEYDELVEELGGDSGRWDELGKKEEGSGKSEKVE
jgi:hypothetical protein